MSEFQIIAAMDTQSKVEQGRDVAEDRAIYQYLSDCKDAVAHVMRSSRGMHCVVKAPRRQQQSRSNALKT
jgi:hypothetical protein